MKTNRCLARLFAAFIILICSAIALAQEAGTYSELIAEAESLYEKGDYYESGLKYSNAFLQHDLDRYSIINRYEAACAWAKAHETDSAFTQLYFLANNLYTKENIQYIPISFLLYIPDHLEKDEDMTSVRSDEKWDELMSLLEEKRSMLRSGIDEELIAVLDTIYKEDQLIRIPIDSIAANYGWESKELKDYSKNMHLIDSIHLMKIERILSTHGWLGADVIGYEGNMTLWLVIQHSPIEVQEKYLPVMREAVSNGNARPDHLAYLEDRVAVLRDRKQVYGTQIVTDSITGEFLVSSLADPYNVDKRRAEVGLGPLQEYLLQWGLSWDLEDFKRKDSEQEETR